MRSQRGASGLFVAVILLIAAVAAIAVYALSRGAAKVERGSQIAGSFKIVQDALLQYVAANGRLPCPANPALDSGDSDPAGASTACNSPTGTVPWKEIGVRREDAIDPWAAKISYRVYSGGTGLTQTDGASMVDCDTVEPSPQGTAGGGLCRATHDTTEVQFLNGKGLTVNSFGTVNSGIAYVLISHGPSGLGAFPAGAPAIQKPLPASVDEIANLAAAGPFVAKAASAQGIGPDDPAHFDDLLVFAEIGDLIRRAGRGARDWPDSIVTSVTFNSATLTAALGAAPGADTGQSTIAFTGVTASAFDSGGSENISFSTVDGVAGIGGASGGSGISSNGLEGVTLAFGQKARKLGITFSDFGVNGQFADRAELRFFDGATLLATTVVQACNTHNPTDPPASFTIDLGTVDFDNVEIRALVTTPNGGGSTRDSTFLIAAVATCSSTATTCQSPLYDSSNACP